MVSVGAKIIGSLVGFIILGLIIWFIYNWLVNDSIFGTIGNTIGDIGSYLNTPATCDTTPPPGANEEYVAGLCYKKCLPGWSSDGALLCYKGCPIKGDPGYPNGWEGKSTLAFCEKNTKYSTVGTTDTIPTQCSGTKINSVGLCYDVPAGWKVTSPGFIGETCDTVWKTTGVSYRDDGTGCWLDADSYGTGVGTIPNVSCDSGFSQRGVGGASWCDNGPRADFWNLETRSANITCPAGKFLSAGLCYTTCKPGYTQTGATCNRLPQVKYRSIRSQVGTLPDKCSNNKELFGRLCYPACPSGYERKAENLEFCSQKCPSDFKDIGIGGCQKPRDNRGVGVPVHKCPANTTLKGLFCYPKN